jgi:peptide/nickel transport system substrate-binding protein
MDEIIDIIRESDTTDYDLLQPIGLELLQLYIQNLPAISGTTSLDPYAVSDYYWTGWPSGEDPFIVPYHHYPNFKFLLTVIEPTGR